MCPRHGESTAREAAGSDRRGEPTARPADEETGAAERSDQAPRARQRDTAIETVAQSNASTRNTWPRDEARRAEAPTTPTADRGRKGDQYRQQHPAPGRRREVEHFRTPPERWRDAPRNDRRQTTDNALDRAAGDTGRARKRHPEGAASNAAASPVTATETPARRAPKTAANARAGSTNAGSRRPPTDGSEGPRGEPGSGYRATLPARGQHRIEDREADHEKRANACC